jgi:uncharacterized membrane protein (DUF106 family)
VKPKVAANPNVIELSDDSSEEKDEDEEEDDDGESMSIRNVVFALMLVGFFILFLLFLFIIHFYSVGNCSWQFLAIVINVFTLYSLLVYPVKKESEGTLNFNSPIKIPLAYARLQAQATAIGTLLCFLSIMFFYFLCDFYLSCLVHYSFFDYVSFFRSFFLSFFVCLFVCLFLMQ